MAKLKPFLFEYSFDDGADDARKAAEDEVRRAAEEAEANRPPTFTVEELEAAKQEAYDKGRQDGMDDAMAGIEQQVARTLDAVFSRVPKVFEQHKAWTREIETDAARLGIAVIRRVAPELVKDNELPEVEAVIREAFGFLTEQPKVMIRVSKELEEPLAEKVNLMASRVGYEGQVVLVGDPELPIDDCRVSWQAGAVERSLDDVWSQIDQIVGRTLDGAPAREQSGTSDTPEAKAPEPEATGTEPGEAGAGEAGAGDTEMAESDMAESETGVSETGEAGQETDAPSPDTEIDPAEEPVDAGEAEDTEPQPTPA